MKKQACARHGFELERAGSLSGAVCRTYRAARGLPIGLAFVGLGLLAGFSTDAAGAGSRYSHRLERAATDEGFTGRVTWGSAGVARILWSPEAFVLTKRTKALSVIVVNEGGEPLALSRDDSWLAVTERDEEVRLSIHEDEKCRPWDGSAGIVAPGDSARVCLVPEPAQGARIVEIRYRGEDIEIRARTPYRAPLATLVAPPVFPAPMALKRRGVLVEIAALVGSDGRVEDASVVHVDENAEEYVEEYAEAAREAVLSWEFAPAREGGEPTRWRHHVLVPFCDWRAVQARFSISESEFGARLEPWLEGRFTGVAPVRGTGGFVVRGRKNVEGDVRSAKVFLIRLSEVPSDPGATWITVVAASLFASKGMDSCGGDWWESQPFEAWKFLEAMQSELEMAADETRVLATEFIDHVPGPEPEAPESAHWDYQAIRSFLRVSLDAKKGKKKPSSRLPGGSSESHPEIHANRRTIFDLLPETSPPRRIRFDAPVYPLWMQQEGIQGQVLLEAVIGTDGRVSGLDMLQGSAHLARSAMEAVCCWRYEPTMKDGEPVQIRIRIQVDFRVDRHSDRTR